MDSSITKINSNNISTCEETQGEDASVTGSLQSWSVKSETFPTDAAVHHEIPQTPSPDLIETKSLLQSWGFSEVVCNKILSLKLTPWHLQAIEDPDINDIFPFEEIADRIKFKKHLNIWRQQSLMQNHADQDSPKSSPPKAKVSTVIKEKNVKTLKDIIDESFNGKVVLKYYEIHRVLKDEHRRIIVDLIIEHNLQSDNTITLQRMGMYATEIKKIFPTEVESTYFIPRKSGGKPQGKLYDRHKSSLSTMRNLGVLNERYKPPIDAKPRQEPSIDNETYESMRSWLKSNYNSSDWAEVCRKYKATVGPRIKTFHSQSFKEILREWPCLKDIRGQDFIEMDFESLHRGKESEFLVGWQVFKRKAPQLYSSVVEDENCLKLLTKLNGTSLAEDTRDYIVLMLLHAVLKPTCRIQIKEGKKKVWRPNIADSQNGQIMHLKSLNDLDKQVDNMKAKYKKIKLKIQPFVIVIGETIYDLKLFYVYVNNTYYKFDTFLKSVDFCFKLFQVFNFQYAKECQLVWLFIQKHFFNIHTAYDDNSTVIASVLSSLSSIP